MANSVIPLLFLFVMPIVIYLAGVGTGIAWQRQRNKADG